MTAKMLSLIVSHRTGLLASVRSKVRPPVDPADIVQETMARAIPAIEAGHVEDVQSYIYGIARNLAAEAMRQQQRWSRWIVHHPATETIADDAPSAEAHVAGRDEWTRLRRAVDMLPPRCREVFSMRHIEMLEKTEIACLLGITVKQVEKQLRQGLVLCTQLLQVDDGELNEHK